MTISNEITYENLTAQERQFLMTSYAIGLIRKYHRMAFAGNVPGKASGLSVMTETHGASRAQSGDNYVSHHFNHVVTKRPAVTSGNTKLQRRKTTRVKSLVRQRREAFAGMSDKLAATVKPIDLQPVDAVRPQVWNMRPEAHLPGHSDMLAKASDEKTRAVNLAVRLRRIPIAVQLNQLLAHKQKLISQADAAYRHHKIRRASNLIKQIEINDEKTKALILELQDNGVDFGTLNTAFSSILKTL